MLPQPITVDSDPCDLVWRWRIDERLARKLIAMVRASEFAHIGLSIISGARTFEQQRQLELEGRPAADWHRTTHADRDLNGCPRLSTGVDVRPGLAAVPEVKVALGRAATFAGLRWGGGSSVDPQTGIPSDWNHLDLGPR